MSTLTTEQVEHEILLVMNDQQYRDAKPCLDKLKAAGAPSNTVAILEALRVASSMVPTDRGSTNE